MTREFIISAVAREQFPRPTLPEIAFLGRSNVGKSTLLNALAGGRDLAFTSSRPGCTQTVNFFRVGDYRFVDLPGYGYARVPREKLDEFKRMAEAYLAERTVLVLCVLLVDARRGWTEKDMELKRWLESRGKRLLVVVTKMDKLKTAIERQRGLAAVRQHIAQDDMVPFSAPTGQGVREIWQTISRINTRP